jgi:hypothetical protein
MPIKRRSIQKSMTLEEFYVDLSADSVEPTISACKGMICFIDLINEIFKKTNIWGLTSHARLVLQNTDEIESEWLVIVSSLGTNEYYFEYLIPKERQPWDSAYVRGQANSVQEAKRYLLIAMTESGGWIGNEELETALSSIL